MTNRRIQKNINRNKFEILFKKLSLLYTLNLYNFHCIYENDIIWLFQQRKWKSLNLSTDNTTIYSLNHMNNNILLYLISNSIYSQNLHTLHIQNIKCLHNIELCQSFFNYNNVLPSLTSLDLGGSDITYTSVIAILQVIYNIIYI